MQKEFSPHYVTSGISLTDKIMLVYPAREIESAVPFSIVRHLFPSGSKMRKCTSSVSKRDQGNDLIKMNKDWPPISSAEVEFCHRGWVISAVSTALRSQYLLYQSQVT
jgi:hypothetical protein